MDDDVYAPEEYDGVPYDLNGEPPAESRDDLEEGEEGEEVEDGDSDEEDITFITDEKKAAKEGNIALKPTPQSTASLTDELPPSQTPVSAVKAELPRDQNSSSPVVERPGTDFPGRHTSTIDPNANPVHPATGKPILSTDFDTDFTSESSKPWRKPGADITDFFNYGFDEFTWASYCLKHQQEMPKELSEIKAQADSMKSFLEGIPGGGFPGMPGVPAGPGAQGANGSMPNMPGMPGMPNEAEMQQSFRTMIESGMDPNSMSPEQFMQQMMMGGGPNFNGQNPGFGAMGGGQQQQQPQMGFGGGNAGRGGFDQGGNFGKGRGRGRRGW